ncbi:MAG TPA: IS701 family transposase [Chloroflexota bacterium]|nr:IS701 family transposase [Chloroflexota bacterium]
MTPRGNCPPAPGPLEDYARGFDDLFSRVAQRGCFRDCLVGLLLPRDRNKTLTGLAGAEPIVQAQAAPVQRLQWFLSEANWEVEAVNDRRIALVVADPVTRPHGHGVLILDETGDRKDGTKTAHVGYQYLGSIGKIANGIVAVSSAWADEGVYYPLHIRPYEPAARLPRGKADPAFRTKPALAVALVTAARAAGIPFEAVVADSVYGENPSFEAALWEAGVPYVLSVHPSRGRWGPAEAAHTPEEAARELRWTSPEEPGDWTAVERSFRDGHTETWWAADLRLAGQGPDRPTRLVVATTDPATLPAAHTWYLTTNRPHPDTPHPGLVPASLAAVVRLYGLRQWVEQSYKQVKQELGWADFQVRSDRAIRRHWALVCCAFSFCWWTYGRHEALALIDAILQLAPAAPAPESVGGKTGRRRLRAPASALLAGGPPPGAELAGPVDHALALVARLVHGPAAPAPPRVA